MNDWAIRCVEWLSRRALEAEEKDPELRVLKNRISELGEKSCSVGEEERHAVLRDQEEAIQELINRVAGKKIT